VSDATVEKGKVVSLSYSLKDQNGELYEYRDVPEAYVHGAGSELFPRLEQALAGHRKGDRVTVALRPEDGFGERDPDLTFTDDLANVPEEFRRIGAEVEMRSDHGESRLFYVTRIENGRLTVDGNHPLAGQAVTFEVTINGIRDATEAELRNGRPDAAPAGGLLKL